MGGEIKEKMGPGSDRRGTYALEAGHLAYNRNIFRIAVMGAMENELLNELINIF